jgi:hypothetical protein
VNDAAFEADLLAAARAVGRAYLPGDEDLAFGFVQRALVHLQQAGRPRGLLFPKFDAEYRRMFDYMDGEGTVWVLCAADVAVDPAWFVDHDAGDPERPYFQVAEGAETRIVQAFLDALAALKASRSSQASG